MDDMLAVVESRKSYYAESEIAFVLHRMAIDRNSMAILQKIQSPSRSLHRICMKSVPFLDGKGNNKICKLSPPTK